MRASAQIRKRDAGRRKRVNCEMGGLFGLGTVPVFVLRFSAFRAHRQACRIPYYHSVREYRILHFTVE